MDPGSGNSFHAWLVWRETRLDVLQGVEWEWELGWGRVCKRGNQGTPSIEKMETEKEETISCVAKPCQKEIIGGNTVEESRPSVELMF
jgi:hypothetical protein